jgi:Pentapeptide repeats (8 copies)
LLATHENGRGPIDWSDESQRGRYGLDLRGADLRDAFLSYLPLACVGRVESEIVTEFEFQFKISRTEAAIIHLEGANFLGAHLEDADFSMANLEKAEFGNAHLEKANFSNANLKGAQFRQANLKEAFIVGAHLEGASLSEAHLEGAVLPYAHLAGANIQEAFFDGLTRLNESIFGDREYGAVSLADVHWGDLNVAVVNWSTITVLGDEVEAKKRKDYEGRDKENLKRFDDYQTATRAYRQFSVVLRNQGLNEDAARFAYRAQLMQRKVFWYQPDTPRLRKSGVPGSARWLAAVPSQAR